MRDVELKVLFTRSLGRRCSQRSALCLLLRLRSLYPGEPPAHADANQRGHRSGTGEDGSTLEEGEEREGEKRYSRIHWRRASLGLNTRKDGVATVDRDVLAPVQGDEMHRLPERQVLPLASEATLEMASDSLGLPGGELAVQVVR
jgi:hypothetical protein